MDQEGAGKIRLVWISKISKKLDFQYLCGSLRSQKIYWDLKKYTWISKNRLGSQKIYWDLKKYTGISNKSDLLDFE